MNDEHEADDEVQAMIALEAVGALTTHEREDLERALRRRPDVRAELDELRAVASLMVVEEAPPQTLRSSVLDAVAATPQESERAAVVHLADRRRNRWFAVGAAAAAIVALAVGAVVVVSNGGPSTDDEIVSVMEDSAARTIPMDGELDGLSIVHSDDQDAAVLTGAGLPVPEGERVYELWALRDEAAPERVGIFRPTADGAVTVYLDGLDPNSARWAVTEEPAGGSDTPTLPILAATA